MTRPTIIHLIIWVPLIVLLAIGVFMAPVANEAFGTTSGWLSAGVLSRGVLSAGVFSAGVSSAGLFSVGIFSAGLFSLGVFSIGTFVLGVWATGPFVFNSENSHHWLVCRRRCQRCGQEAAGRGRGRNSWSGAPHARGSGGSPGAPPWSP